MVLGVPGCMNKVDFEKKKIVHDSIALDVFISYAVHGLGFKL